MHSPIALESLIQKGRSPFYKDLVSLFQDSQKELRGVPKTSAHEIYTGLKNIDFTIRLRAIIKTQMGVELNKLIIVESSVPNAESSMQPTTAFNLNVKEQNKTSGMMIEEIHRVYDHKKGRIDLSNDYNPLIGFSLVFSTAFWSTRSQTDDFYFTAEELAAVALHEIGHIDHYIRTAFRINKRIIDASDIVTYIKSHQDRDTILALLDSLKMSPHLDKSWQKILTVTSEYFTTTNSFDDLYYWEALASLSALATAEVSNRNLIEFLGMTGNIHGKVKTKTYEVDAERSADEFAARHGAYSALVSSQVKTDKLDSTDAKLRFDQTNLSIASSVFGTMFRFISAFDLGAEQVSDGYDPLIRRLELVVETAKHAFHNTALPNDVKDDIRAQITEAEKYIHLYRSSNHHKVRASIKTWKDNVGKLGRIVAAPFQNRLAQDYERLQNSTRALSRNPLYYLADKR